MNIEPAFTVLRLEQLLIDHSPHSVQFERLTGRLLRTFSAAAVIPPLTLSEIQLYAALALLHDVGKRAIPQEILNKPGHLTQEEFEVMKSHITDTLIHLRVYKPAYPQKQARDMIVTGACGVFHPLLLACFAQHIGAICTAVYSSSG